jgi:2-iminobutanoate/2-iminopropanoate deaminase
MRRTVLTENAPIPIGPYSQAIVCKNMVYCSGQLGLVPSTGRMIEGGPEKEAAQALSNLRHVLEAAGSSMEKVVRCTIFVTDLDDFKDVNQAYAGSFPGDPPARTTVQVERLPLGGKVEIDAIAEI